MKKLALLFVLLLCLFTFGCGGNHNWGNATNEAIQKEIQNSDVMIEMSTFGVSEGSKETKTGGVAKHKDGLYCYKFNCTFDTKTGKPINVIVNGPFPIR